MEGSESACPLEILNLNPVQERLSTMSEVHVPKSRKAGLIRITSMPLG